MEEFALVLREYVKRRRELEEGIIPFVEPNSVAENMAFDELFFINRQISTLIYGCKKIV